MTTTISDKVRLHAYRPTVAEIDLDALRENVRSLKNRVGEKQFMAVVKTNAYGHGLMKVANTVLQAGA